MSQDKDGLEVPVEWIVAMLAPGFCICICCVARFRKDQRAKDEKRHALARRGTSDLSEVEDPQKAQTEQGHPSVNWSDDLETADAGRASQESSRARELWQIGINKAKSERASPSGLASSNAKSMWKKGLSAVMRTKKDKALVASGKGEAKLGEAEPKASFKKEEINWWDREESSDEDEKEEEQRRQEAKMKNKEYIPRPRPTVRPAEAAIASQRVRAMYENRGAIEATLSTQSITHAEARCAAERALLAMDDAPAPPKVTFGHKLSSPMRPPGAPAMLRTPDLPPAPPPPGEPPQFVCNRPEETACRFRFNCSCRKFRGAEVKTEEDPREIDWEAPCLDCGHARMYHRRTVTGGTSGCGRSNRRTTPFEILEGFVPPWRQGQTDHNTTFFYNPRTNEIRNVEDGIERFDEKAAVEALGNRGSAELRAEKLSAKAKAKGRATYADRKSRKTNLTGKMTGKGGEDGAFSPRNTTASPSRKTQRQTRRMDSMG